MNIENNQIIENLNNEELTKLYKKLKEYHNPFWHVYGDNSELLLSIGLKTEKLFDYQTKHKRISEAIRLDNISKAFNEKTSPNKDSHESIVHYICAISDIKFDESAKLVMSVDSHEAASSWIMTYINNLNSICSDKVVFKKDWINSNIKRFVFFDTLEAYIPDTFVFFEELIKELDNQPKALLTQYDIVQLLLKTDSHLLSEFVNKHLCYFTSPNQNTYFDFIKSIENKVFKINLKEQLNQNLTQSKDIVSINKI